MHIGVTAGGRLARDDGNGLVELDFFGDVAEAIRQGVDIQHLPTLGEVSEDQLGAPILPGKIVAIGLNYRTHAAEVGMDAPSVPQVFSKFVSSVVGPTADIEIDRSLTKAVDWEVELGVVVGKRMDRVAVEDALDHVFGYTVSNDVSARDVQMAEQQWIRAKSMNTFCPVGPVVVTRDEIPDPQDLRVWTRVNSETMQDASTADMIFTVAELLSYCSRSFTLDPGDLLITGTPAGVGAGRKPPIFLNDGDLLEVGVDGIGVLANRVREIAIATA
jgi:5-carboxymethyl-2-hydroxymuconate isomerase